MESNRTFAIIDIKTTGKGIRNNRIAEICISRIEKSIEVEKFSSLVNPEQRIPNYITARTGIADDTVYHAPTFAEIAEEIDQLIKGVVLVAHNVSFVYHVLRSEFRYMGYNLTCPKLCTLRLTKKLIPNLLSYELPSLCSSLGIPFMYENRAEGGTEATVILFKRLLSLDEDLDVIAEMLKSRDAVARLPRHIDSEQFVKLPSKPGIYKFQNKEGCIIYIGKAKHIKNRVLSHFQNSSEKETTLCAATFSIDFELTGSELIALLLEADLIQNHLPKYNTVQKKSRKAFHIKSYFNKKGILQMAVEECPTVNIPTELFFTKGAAIKKLEKLCDGFNLCPKFLGLQRKKGRCAHIKFPHCLGVCCGEEEVHLYNYRAEKGLATLKADTETYILQEKGRRQGEQAFVLVLHGVYQGFGFVDGSQQVCSVDEMIDLIRPRKNTYHIGQILKAYRKKRPNQVRMIKYAKE